MEDNHEIWVTCKSCKHSYDARQDGYNCPSCGHNNELKLLRFLQSDQFILYVAIFTVIFLSPNTYYVYDNLSRLITPYREIASAGAALITSASIMIYTLRKNYAVAEYYAWFEMSISAYYYIETIGFDWPLIPALSFTIMLPLSLKGYSREIKSSEHITIIEREKEVVIEVVREAVTEPEIAVNNKIVNDIMDINPTVSERDIYSVFKK